ncbi:MAG TPA: hypothetical protein VEK07_07500 [Polyangiaceae bacterium]|nr:hypothetical protein [Polyangiaceae bacterium]
MASTDLRTTRSKVAVAAATVALSVCPIALADGDARASIQALEHDTSHRAIVADAVGRAKEALERATRLHALHDEPHAAEADALALEWAAIGRDLMRAVRAEEEAAEVRRKATDAQAQLERSRALVEEAIARVGRLEIEIARAQRPGGASRIAVEAHDGQPPPASERHPPSPEKALEAPAPKVRPDGGSDAKP